MSSEIEIEIRAAELHMLAGTSMSDSIGEHDGVTNEEAIGWGCHRDDEDPRSDAAWAGWLAREMFVVEGLIESGECPTCGWSLMERDHARSICPFGKAATP